MIVLQYLTQVHVDTPDGPLPDQIRGVAIVVAGLFVLCVVSLLFKKKR